MVNQVSKQTIAYFGNDIKRVNHALKVFGFANTIICTESANPQIIAITQLSALLHDIGIPEAERKYGSCMGKYQEIEGPPVAKIILTNCSVAPNLIERICFIIGNHHSYTKIDDIDFQVLVEADFLVNIFEDEINLNSIESIKNKYFKTKTGLFLLNSMYNK